jgi:CO/xanthine dehydrogenase Mo-binding subunit
VKVLIGNPDVVRKEAAAKLAGEARYVDDAEPPGVLHGVTVRTPAPRGRLTGVRFLPGVPWDEIVVVTAKDIPGRNHVHLILDDQPVLVDDEWRHAEEPVVLLAHADRHVAARARERVELVWEPLPACLDLDQSLAKTAVVWGKENVFKEYWIRKGDVDAAFARPELTIVEGTYETGAQEQLYIEPNGVIARVELGGDGVYVEGSLQCPYYVQKALMPIFATDPAHTRVVQLETGGGFGGKEEYPSMIAAHAALLSHKAGGRPVKLVYERGEDMVATTKRHPSRTHLRAAVDRSGRLVALDIDFILDGGAYATLSQVVLSRGLIHAAGPYRIENIRARGRALATSTPPHGAFRGFGAPQSLFALERHMDVIAARLGLAPEALRATNLVRRGDALATGQVVRDDVDMPALLASAAADFDLVGRRARFAADNRKSPIKRGVGLACFMHGTGFTGAGEKHLASELELGLGATAVEVRSASTEIGQGTSTVFAQIAADALALPYEAVSVVRPDTAQVPDSGPTVASRTVTIVGKLVEAAARALRADAEAAGWRPEQGLAALVALAAPGMPLFGRTWRQRFTLPTFQRWDETCFQGDAYGTYSWAVYLCQVAVDLRTYEARVEDFVAVQEVGKVIHPRLAAGQIEGGVAQGIGWALTEQVAWQSGRMANARFTDYIVPTSVDVPPIRVVFAEAPYPFGPSGAKGIGELPMDGPAPAIGNAIAQALDLGDGGVATRVPFLPETIYAALAARTQGPAR